MLHHKDFERISKYKRSCQPALFTERAVEGRQGQGPDLQHWERETQPEAALHPAHPGMMHQDQQLRGQGQQQGEEPVHWHHQHQHQPQHREGHRVRCQGPQLHR